VPIGVTTEHGFSPNDAHFLTLEFARLGAGARLRVRYWQVVARGITPPDFGKTIWDSILA
jgi:hypothetical protein